MAEKLIDVGDVLLGPLDLYQNYPNRLLPTGEWAAVTPMIYTVALCLGVDRDGYRTRFCYPDRASAEAALAAWDGTGFPPGFWIKQKPEGTPNPELEQDNGHDHS